VAVAENSQGRLPRAGDVKPGCPFQLQSSTDRMLSPGTLCCSHTLVPTLPVTAQNSQVKCPLGTGAWRHSLSAWFQSLHAEPHNHRVACPQSPYRSCECVVPRWGCLSLLQLSSLKRPAHMVRGGEGRPGPLSQGH